MVSTGHPTGDGREALEPGGKSSANSWEQLENGGGVRQAGSCGTGSPPRAAALSPCCTASNFPTWVFLTGGQLWAQILALVLTNPVAWA